jgi:hypothetical protein
VGGLLLLALGIAWFLDVLGVAFPWEIVLPVALVAVGVTLLLVAGRGGSQAGLIATGLVLTVLLVLGSAVDVPLAGGVGERTLAPSSLAGVRDEYRLGIGQLTVDLTGVHDLAAASRTVRMRVGIGQLVVIVPAGVTLGVTARAGLGNVQLFEQDASGFDVERRLAPAPSVGPSLTLSVGLGQVEVRRG